MTNDITANGDGLVEGMARGGTPGNVPGDRGGKVASGVSLVRAVSLIGALERAQFHIIDLVENFDGLPEAYQRDSDLWQRYDELRQACETISDAHARWIGD